MHKQFMKLFQGLNRAYGMYQVKDDPDDEGQKVKGNAGTKIGPVTEKLWEDHLKGKQGLGIIPIKDDAKCHFAAIDIDTYDLDLNKLEEVLAKNNVPCVVCRTKSGGAHLYFFAAEPIPAAQIRTKLMEVAGALGFGGSEIFPKQTKLANDKDVGNWINMPYFDGSRTTRYAIKNGKALSPEDFLAYAEKQKVTAAQLKEVSLTITEELADAPPCLQRLCKDGFPEGTRNTALFALGVYARMKHGDDWEQKMDDLNQAHLDPPLSFKEVAGVVKSLNRKNYGYKCNEEPFQSECNKALCRFRKFGVGANDEEEVPYVLGTLVKHLTDPPHWFIDVDGVRLELTTDELLNQDKFRKLCVEKINKFPPKIKNVNWERVIRERLEEVEEIEAPEDSGVVGQFLMHLQGFLARPPAKTKEQLLLGKVWSDESKLYFRSSDLIGYLKKNNFRDMDSKAVWLAIREIGGEPGQFNIKKTCVRWWSIPEEIATGGISFDIPEDLNQANF